MKKALLIIILFFVYGYLFAQKETPIYSFFAAGHTYGNPNDYHLGLHYPFVDYFPNINDYPNMELGFLTGDVVYQSTAIYWDSAEIDMNQLNMPLYISAGNHDVSSEFINRFGSYYSSFVFNNDLFIRLSVSESFWNITGDQLDFFINSLDEYASSVNHIFIFLHELIWWSPTNEYQDIIINFEPIYPGSTNFDPVIKPLLLSYSNPITLYAGDLGATTAVSFVMYDHYDNITLIASGMGGGVNDNIIITNVYEDSVYYDLVAINGDNPNALGELTDYSLISSTQETNHSNLTIFPNPATDFVYLHVSEDFITSEELSVQLINNMGILVDRFTLRKTSNKIDLRNYNTGVYYFIIQNRSGFIETYKIVIL